VFRETLQKITPLFIFRLRKHETLTHRLQSEHDQKRVS